MQLFKSRLSYFITMKRQLLQKVSLSRASYTNEFEGESKNSGNVTFDLSDGCMIATMIVMMILFMILIKICYHDCCSLLLNALTHTLDSYHLIGRQYSDYLS
jgi:Cu/Ag efflux pump CusA